MKVLIIKLLTDLKKFENDYLNKPTWYGLIIARGISIITFFLTIVLLSIIVVLFSLYILKYIGYHYVQEPKHPYALMLLLALPTLIPLLTNFFNKKFNFSGAILNIINVSSYSVYKVNCLRLALEIFLLILYVYTATTLTLYTLTNFINEDTLFYLLSEKYPYPPILFTIITIHISIYITLRVLFLPEENEQQKAIKAKRKYWLWLLAMIVTVAYMVNKLLTTDAWYDYIYFIFVLLLTFDRVINSYKELKGLVLRDIEKNKI